MKKSVCLSQDLNLGSLIYLYGLIQPIQGRNRVKTLSCLRGGGVKNLPNLLTDSTKKIANGRGVGVKNL